MKLKKKYIFLFAVLLIFYNIARTNTPNNSFKNLGKNSPATKPVSKDTLIQILETNDSIDEDSIDENDSIEGIDSIQEVIDTVVAKPKNYDAESSQEETNEAPPSNLSGIKFYVPKTNHPLKKNISLPFAAKKGLENRHIALWQSHGLYYKQSQERWRWQRENAFETREDLYTQSYVLPFIVPMLENAGATVLLPRERDINTEEIIVDNDLNAGGSAFTMTNGKNGWQKGTGAGFAHRFAVYTDGENPFRTGTYEQSVTVGDKEQESIAEWLPEFKKEGDYAVYVSYKTLPNSTNSAVYTVYHQGGETKFSVNQTMGSSTWIYLGTFSFAKGKNSAGKITLTNRSSDVNKIITADAVKIGGGMGNISRKRSDLVTKRIIKIPIKYKKGQSKYTHKTVVKYVGKGKHKKKKKVSIKVHKPRYQLKTITNVQHFYNYSVSNMPRFTEGARYWLHWAGIPDSIYSQTDSENDYSDDYQSRGYWVNYLIGGSPVSPHNKGLNIPVDLALALHTDAGRYSENVLGTLAIHTYRSKTGATEYKNGVSRWAGRELTDLVQTQVVNDIRKLYDDTWIRRELWNRAYSESRVADVPNMILELLSHDNFADMRYGQDPRFRFMVSRAIYKAMLRFVAGNNGYDYVVQPLPVETFSAEFADSATVKLKWQPVNDPLENTAKPSGYIVYTRTENGGFNNGEYVKDNFFNKKIEKNKIYSFKVEAVNDGGKSFPSEILSVCKTKSDTTVLIVNGFNRISAPASFDNGETAGFNNNWDAGVPYINDYKYTGKQTEFRKNKRYAGEDGGGFGTSEKGYEGKVIAGNTFDYPYVHGKAIKNAGYSFVSCSEKSIETGEVLMNNYKAVDLILGKERQWTDLKKYFQSKTFKTFTPEMRNAINNYTKKSGNIFITGAHVASDLSIYNQTTDEEYSFLWNTLKIKWAKNKINGLNQVQMKNFKKMPNQNFSFYAEPNSECYFVEAPDIMEPTDKKASSIAEYGNNGLSAGVMYEGSYKSCIFGFPFETIKEEDARNKLMYSVLDFFFSKKK